MSIYIKVKSDSRGKEEQLSLRPSLSVIYNLTQVRVKPYYTVALNQNIDNIYSVISSTSFEKSTL